MEKIAKLIAFLDTVPRKVEEVTGEEVLYVFPLQETGPSSLALKILLLFVALRNITKDVLTDPITVVALEAERIGELSLKAAFVLLRDCVFVMALPVSLSDFACRCLVRSVFDFIGFTYGSIETLLQAGERDPSDDTRLAADIWLMDLRDDLDAAFARVYPELLGKADKTGLFLHTFEMGVPYFYPGSELQGRVGEILTALEASDRRVAQLYMVDSRVNLIVGSCLFCRRRVIRSHLNLNDTKQIGRFCEMSGLLSRSPNAPQYENTLEVFITTHTTDQPDQSTLYHREKRLLVVLAQQEEVLCLLLHPRVPAARELNPFYVKEMHDTMEHLRTSGTLESIRFAMSIPQVALKSVPQIPAVTDYEIAPRQEELPYMISGSSTPALIHYVSYNKIDGAILSSIDAPIAAAFAPIHEAFWRACLLIKPTLLELAGRPPDGLSEEDKARHFAEFGMRISVARPDPKSPNAEDGYWVIGRLFLQGEFYVCYADSVPQSTMELAFKLRSGYFA